MKACTDERDEHADTLRWDVGSLGDTSVEAWLPLKSKCHNIPDQNAVFLKHLISTFYFNKATLEHNDYMPYTQTDTH